MTQSRIFYRVFIILLLGIIIFSKPCLSELTLEPEIERLFIEGVHFSYHDQIHTALSKYDSICVLDSLSPIGPFCKAFVYDLFMDEYRTLKFMDEFNSEVKHAIELGEKQVEEGKDTAETFLFLGGVYGIRGVRKAMLGDWWGAYKDAMKGIKGVKKSVEIDTALYDAYYGIGNYHYWKSARIKMLLWLPFISDDREKGIKELYLSVEKGKFTPIPSQTALLRIFIEEKRWDDCIKAADALISEYYPDLQPRWCKAYSLIKLERWEEAYQVYQEIFQLLKAKDFYGTAGEAEVWYYQALCNYNLGNKEKTQELLAKVFSLKENVNEKIFFFDNVFEEAESLRKKIE